MADIQLSMGTMLIGETLFINGSPHKICGHCGKIIGSDEYQRKSLSSGAVKSKGKIVKDGKVTFELKPYMISILMGWIDLGEEITCVDGYPTVKVNRRPKIMQKAGCFECWNTQQRNGGWYDVKSCQNPKLEALMMR